MTANILIIDDEKRIRMILTQILGDEGYVTASAASGEEALERIETFVPDLILMDQNMPGMNGVETMERIRSRMPDATVIFLTAHGSITHAVDAMKRGAYDYLTKPFDNDELLLAVNRATERTHLANEVTTLRRQLRDQYRFASIVGDSPPMRRLFDQMRRVSGSNATVLVLGESGTGKELVARALHYESDRRDGPLVSVNCGAIPATLIESEIFGHEQGAFTDARARKSGKFEQADGGTLFLDEIGELPPDAQVKLLRIIEDRTVTRLGASKAIPVDVRIIAATNKDLETEVAAGRFRLDLLYRLNVFTLTIPPLRERSGDIPLLAEHFLAKHREALGSAVTSISRSAIDALVRHTWPGNVRDLENALQSAMILTTGSVLGYEDLPLRVRGYPTDESTNDNRTVSLDERIGLATTRMEKDIITETLRSNDGNRTRTAGELGISRKTLFNKMKKFGLDT